MWSVLLVVLAAIVSITRAGPVKQEDREALQSRLLEHYDINKRPTLTNGSTMVQFSFYAEDIWLEEEKHILNVNSWVFMHWTDHRLAWDKSKGLYMTFGDKKIWQPDIMLYNSADRSQVDPYNNTYLYVLWTGDVFWHTPAVFRVRCLVDISHWPFDTHTCTLYFGSWTSNGLQIDLHVYRNRTEVRKSWLSKYSTMWSMSGGKIIRNVRTYRNNEVPYITLHTILKIVRTWPAYYLTVAMPACVVSLLTLSQFLLPLRDRGRLTLGCTSTLMTLLMLFYLAQSVPHVGKTYPIIVKFFGESLLVTIVSIILSIFIIRLVDPQSPLVSSPPPAILKTILTGRLSSILQIHSYTQKVGHSANNMDDGMVLTEGSHSISYVHEWILVAAAVDRVAAAIFCLTYIIILISYVATI